MESSSREDFALLIIDAGAGKMRRCTMKDRACVAEWTSCGGFSPYNVARDEECARGRKIQCASPRCAKNFLTFAIENSFVVTLVSQLAKLDHHFFLDFIFH
jgi:hypothetical protein